MIFQYLQDYRYNSILVKSLIIILTVLICSFAVIMILVTNQMNNSIEKEVGIMSENTLSKTQNRMDTVMREVVQISGQLSLDSDLMLVMLPESNQLLDRNSIQALKNKIETHSGVVDYIDSIYIYSSKNNIVVTNEGVESIEQFKDMTWFDNLTERIYEPGHMITRLKEDNYPYLISYIQPVRLTQMEFLGGIIVNIDIGKLDELVISNVENSKENLMIVDERNNIIFSSNQEYLLKKVNTLDYYDALEREGTDGYQIINDGEQDLVLTVASSDYFKWKYISTVPLSMYDEYQEELSDFFILLIFLIVLISCSGAVFISYYCYKPVMNILNLLKNPSLYEKRVELGESFQKDEAQEISLNIIRNIYSNQQMQKEMNDYINIIDKAQITALQAQISPHFLYNTLENIRWRVIEELNGDNQVAQSILKLSEMMRISLDNEQQIITIREEIRNAKIYIEILQLRYENKLKVDWDVDQRTLDLPIVKISLQPIIENAVYHGIKPLRGTGLINISVQKLAESIFIKISDNGIGMSVEELYMLNQDLGKRYLFKEDHIGIRNVNQRLQLLIGRQASMKVQSTINKGTTVTMEIPILLQVD